MLLSELESTFKRTKRHATPHRHPDFKHIREMCELTDPDVHMRLVFVEPHNTGYDDVLHRYICTIKGTNPIVFQIDLRPEDYDAEAHRQ